jgi:hypothetical protein
MIAFFALSEFYGICFHSDRHDITEILLKVALNTIKQSIKKLDVAAVSQSKGNNSYYI